MTEHALSAARGLAGGLLSFSILSGVVPVRGVLVGAAPAGNPSQVQAAEGRTPEGQTSEGQAPEAQAPQGVRDARQRQREAARQRQQERARVRQELARQYREARRQGPGLTETVSLVHRLGRTGTLELTNTLGHVQITGGGGDDVRINAVKRVWHADDAQGKAQLQQLHIRIAERGGVVSIRTDNPSPREINGLIDYTVSVPATAMVVVRTTAGNVQVTNVRGELRAETVSGHVTASSLGPRSTLKTASGDVEISASEGTELSASTVSGAVLLRGVKVRTLDLASVSGQVRADVEAERVRVRSISGQIEYAGTLSRNGRYELQSHSGDVLVTPGESVGFELDATTFSGDIRSDVALTVNDTRQGPPRARGNRRIVGVAGDGSALLSLRSFSGDIRLRRR
jgi:DUF4097 and DUF4098 domain-containing protein YvlB